MELAIVLRDSTSLVIYCVPGWYRAQEAQTSRPEGHSGNRDSSQKIWYMVSYSES